MIEVFPTLYNNKLLELISKWERLRAITEDNYFEYVVFPDASRWCTT